MTTAEIIAIFFFAALSLIGVALRVRAMTRRIEERERRPDDEVRKAVGDEECFM